MLFTVPCPMNLMVPFVNLKTGISIHEINAICSEFFSTFRLPVLVLIFTCSGKKEQVSSAQGRGKASRYI